MCKKLPYDPSGEKRGNEDIFSVEPFTLLQEKISLASKEGTREGEGNYTYAVRLFIIFIKLMLENLNYVKV